MMKLNSKRGGVFKYNPLRRSKDTITSSEMADKNNIDKNSRNINHNKKFNSDSNIIHNKDLEEPDPTTSEFMSKTIENMQACLQCLVEIKDSNDERLQNLEATMDEMVEEHRNEMEEMKGKMDGFKRDIMDIDQSNKERESRFRLAFKETKEQIEEQEDRMKAILLVISESICKQERHLKQKAQTENDKEKEPVSKSYFQNEFDDCLSESGSEYANIDGEEITMTNEDKTRGSKEEINNVTRENASPRGKEEARPEIKEKTEPKYKEEPRPITTEYARPEIKEKTVPEWKEDKPPVNILYEKPERREGTKPEDKKLAIPESKEGTRPELLKGTRPDSLEDVTIPSKDTNSSKDTMTSIEEVKERADRRGFPEIVKVAESERKQELYPYKGEFIIKSQDRMAYRKMANRRKTMHF